MKVYVLIKHDWEQTDIGPVLATRELADRFVTQYGEGYKVEEWDVLDQLPKRVTMWYAQRRKGEVETGTSDWWDYQVPGLPREGPFAVWAATEEEARSRVIPSVR